jgi:predicted dehydrogenase
MYVIKSQLYGFNGNMHDWHIYPEMGGGMLYDWGVHLIDQILYMVPGKITSVYADLRNVINENVDDYFNILIKFDCGVTAEIELGTYYLTPKRAWFIGGNKGSAMIDGFGGEGKIVRTSKLLENVPNKITMTAAGPTRSFGPPAPGLLTEEPLPEVNVSHKCYWEHFMKAFNGEEEIIVKPAQVRRVLCLMDAVRESAKTGKAIEFEK